MSERIGRACVDFDGVLAENTWPDPRIGRPILQGIAALLDFVRDGYEVVIYTARPASHSARIWRWLAEQGLERAVYDVITGKPLADVYLDDRAVRFERDEETL